MSIDLAAIEVAVRQILVAIGEDPDREGLSETPARVARLYAEIFEGLTEQPEEIVRSVFTEDEHREIVMVRDIPFYSMCEHHLIPFHGKAHVAYMPDGVLTGLSKLARLVESFAKRPQMQERLTSQIADTLMKAVEPLGVLVVVEAEHLCMSMRGVRKPGAVTTTSAVRGIFASRATTRAEAFSLLNR
ncbi:MAG: GTP cyclohydrolase I FolE [Acidimicrobiia bacterium]|nr:GTP cyclohydrolase I FolE [Acidimicrobiia bacterium]